MMIEAITMAALSARSAAIHAGLFVFSRGHRRLLKNGRTCRRGHLEKEYFFTTTQLQRGRVVHVFDCVSRVRAFVKIIDSD